MTPSPSKSSPIPHEAPEAPAGAPQRAEGEPAGEPVSRLGEKLATPHIHDLGRAPRGGFRRRAPMPGILRTTRTDPALSTCGQIRTGHACEAADPDRPGDAHDRFVTVFTCDSPTCEEPACTRKWIGRRAPAAAARIIGATYWHEGISADPVHVTLSPPPRHHAALWEGMEHDTKHAMRAARKEARKIALKAGIRGGVLVFHPHRCALQNDARGRYDATPLKWSPHWHVVGGGWVTWSDEKYSDTGWVVRNHGVRDDTQGTIAYLMDHCAWVEGGHALTFFGHATAYHTRVEELAKEKERCRCSGCERTVMSYRVGADGQVDWDDPMGERELTVRVFLVTATERKDKFPLEFRTSVEEFWYRQVKPPPRKRFGRGQTQFESQFPSPKQADEGVAT